MILCGYAKRSSDTPGHTHACHGSHAVDALHKCTDCRRWFG